MQTQVLKGIGVKGSGVERAAGGVPDMDGTVNVRAWADQVLGNSDCQLGVDTKAFKGKGSLRDLRQLVDRLARVEQEMVELCQASKAAAGVGAYLAMHRRSASGYTHLRWRQRGSWRHLKTGQVQQMLAGQIEQVRVWFGEVAERAERLNEAHAKTRDALAAIRKEIKGRPVHLWPRVIA